MNAEDLEFASPIGARFVPLYGGKAAGRVALVDQADYELVSQYRWHAFARTDRLTYARTDILRDGRRTSVGMHTLILGRGRADHENHDGLDNRRLNLRPATAVQNAANMRKQAGASSQFKGVFWRKDRGAWRAVIHAGGRCIHLGHFSSEVDAARAYYAAARSEWGEFAYPNHPPAGVPAA